jgi:hypothetical protein
MTADLDFERLLQDVEPPTARQAIIDVTDTAYLVKVWFEQHRVAYTAADLASMTSMVLEREKLPRGLG